MYINKNNGKTIKDVSEKDGRVYFTIDGIEVSLPVKIFKDTYYEK